VNLGYARALKRALLATKKDIVFYSDSSGKHNAKDFWKLIRFESKYDIVNGLRKPHSYPIIRRIITFFQRLIVSILFFIPFYDFNTGYKIIHKNIVDDVVKDCRYMNQNFSTEMLLRAYKKGYTIHNVPVKFTDRKDKSKGTNYRDLLGIIFRSLIGFLKLRIDLWNA